MMHVWWYALSRGLDSAHDISLKSRNMESGRMYLPYVLHTGRRAFGVSVDGDNERSLVTSRRGASFLLQRQPEVLTSVRSKGSALSVRV